MAFALTTKCVQYKCHITVLDFLIFYYVVLKLTFYPFFLHPFKFCFKRMQKLVLASPELFTLLPWPISVTCQFLFASSVNYMSLETFFFSHFASNIISSSTFIQLHFKLLSVHFYFFHPQEQQLILGKLTNLQTVPLLSELVL